MTTRKAAIACLLAALGVGLASTASAQQTWIGVDIGCCGIRSTWKYPTEGMRRFTGQIGAVGLSCQQFFSQDTATYPGGLPQRDGTRTINLQRFNRVNVQNDVCRKIRQADATCCEAFTLCEQGCSQTGRQWFNRLYAGLAPDSTTNPATNPSPQAVIDRFLSTCTGAQLLDELVNMPCPSTWQNTQPNCRMGDYLKFRVRFRPGNPRDPEAGSVQEGRPFPDPSADPEAARRFVYLVSISNESSGSPSDGGVLMMDSFPGPGDICFNYQFKDPTSRMAATLYHELLHIWWMNKHETNYSGHGPNVGSCANYEPAFISNLKRFYRAMDAFASCPVTAAPTATPAPTAKPSPTAKPTPTKPGP